jgi:hypothetical protein
VSDEITATRVLLEFYLPPGANVADAMRTIIGLIELHPVSKREPESDAECVTQTEAIELEWMLTKRILEHAVVTHWRSSSGKLKRMQ